MALRLFPHGKGPMAPAVDPYNNTYEGNVDEEVWNVNTTELVKNTMKNIEEGKIESNNYPLDERRSITWSNKPATLHSNNLSPISTKGSPYSSPFTYNRNNNNSNLSFGNLTTPTVALSNAYTNTKHRKSKHRTRRNRKTPRRNRKTPRRNRKTQRHTRKN